MLNNLIKTGSTLLSNYEVLKLDGDIERVEDCLQGQVTSDINDLANAIIDAINNINKEDIKYNQEKINSVYNWEANCYKLIKLYDRVLS